ncbi:hypothetical protein LTR13_009266 [Exophiala sideris]|nr:hypothetical protein LTR13_009266 [Exophiala sideris]
MSWSVAHRNVATKYGLCDAVSTTNEVDTTSFWTITTSSERDWKRITDFKTITAIFEARHERLLRRHNSLVDKYDRMVQKYESKGQDYDSLVQKYDRKCQKYESMGQDYDSLVQRYDREVQRNDKLNEEYESLLHKYNHKVQENDRLDHYLQQWMTVAPDRIKRLEEERDDALARATAYEVHLAKLFQEKDHARPENPTHIAGKNIATDFGAGPGDSCSSRVSRASSHHEPSIRKSGTALSQSLSAMRLKDNDLKSCGEETCEGPVSPLNDSRRDPYTTSPAADSVADSVAPVDEPPQPSPVQPLMRPTSPEARSDFSYQGRHGRRHGHGRGRRGGNQNPAEVVRGHRPPWGQLH